MMCFDVRGDEPGAVDDADNSEGIRGPLQVAGVAAVGGRLMPLVRGKPQNADIEEPLIASGSG